MPALAQQGETNALIGVAAGHGSPLPKDRAPQAPDPWQTARVQKGQQGERTNAAKITTWRTCRSDGSNESAGVGGTTRPRGDQEGRRRRLDRRGICQRRRGGI